MKPLIICIIGESGSGKTLSAKYIERTYGIPMILSWTDRSKRTPNEKGHGFITHEEFDKLQHEDMIAYTQWGDYRYCCLKSDVQRENTYVIDEYGLKYLKDNFSDVYKIYTLRLVRSELKRKQSVGQERADRDKGKFNTPIEDFDFVVHNKNGKDALFDELDLTIKTIRVFYRASEGIDR